MAALMLTKPAYYNEIDPYVAEWLRNLIQAGHIAPGDVDERSIEDVCPDDLRNYTQCHFFAGIGIWSLALRRAGWDDTRPVWTGSCPCQPFSAAGKGAGFADERHLWPAFFHLITQCRPATVFGEQVASADGLAWLDLVQADMEAAQYAFGAADLCAAGVGAPHIRQRLFWVADANDAGLEGRFGVQQRADQCIAGASSLVSGLADSASTGSFPGALAGVYCGEESARPRYGESERLGSISRLADMHGYGREAGREIRPVRQELYVEHGGATGSERPGPTNGFWRAADWLACRDGKWRPVEPSPQQMVDGFAKSLGRLRPDQFQEVVQEVNAFVHSTKTYLREAVFDVWLSLNAEALQRTTRRLSDVREAPVLLAYLRQLADQGWEVAQSLPRASAEVEENGLRMLRERVSIARSSYQRGLDGQQTGKHPDAVRVLSSILARHAQAAWGQTFDRYVSDAFPLIHGLTNRVGRLRAYGNAISPQVAEAFITAFMECQP